ncbi:MAG: ferrochelatase [Arcanobacterium sp.]|nr:ferrochelatase [Arcanobacterium sp.]
MSQGCLLVSLGTPASPAPEDIREFLAAFLSDPSVVDFPKFLWKPILNQIVLKKRPQMIAEQYEKIWLSEGSPLAVYTEAQTKLVAQELSDHDVDYAYTYTKPGIIEQLEAMFQRGVRNCKIIPLFPHYAPSTVAEIQRQVTAARNNPNLTGMNLQIIPQWEDYYPYIEWYAQQINEAWKEHNFHHLVVSYHGVPERKAHEPENYRQQCERTTAAILQALKKFGEPGFTVEQTFQSKFGPGKWLGPATIDRMAELPAAGKTRIAVINPGFVQDCIETLDEIDVLNREAFLEAGGEELHRIAPLNSHPAAGKILAGLLSR